MNPIIPSYAFPHYGNLQLRADCSPDKPEVCAPSTNSECFVQAIEKCGPANLCLRCASAYLCGTARQSLNFPGQPCDQAPLPYHKECACRLYGFHRWQNALRIFHERACVRGLRFQRLAWLLQNMPLPARSVKEMQALSYLTLQLY